MFEKFSRIFKRRIVFDKNKSMVFEIEGYEKFLEIIPEMFRKAEFFVWMSSSLYPKFYNEESVKNSIKSAAERVHDFRLLLDPEIDLKERLKEIKWLKELIKKGKIKVKKAKEKIPHVIIIDGWISRIEKPHPVDVEGRINNLIVENRPLITIRLMSEFIDWWNDAERAD